MSDQLTGSTPVIVALPAEIDLSNAEQVYDQLAAALASGAAVVIADFTGTRFCDCACLNRLLRVHNPMPLSLF
jgi:anti-anti-sigma regulatory factor